MIHSSFVWENNYEHVHCKENKIMFFCFWRTSIIKWKTKNTNRKLVGGDKIYTPNTLIRDYPLSCLGTGTTIKSGEVKLLYGPKTLRSMYNKPIFVYYHSANKIQISNTTRELLFATEGFVIEERKDSEMRVSHQ